MQMTSGKKQCETMNSVCLKNACVDEWKPQSNKEKRGNQVITKLIALEEKKTSSSSWSHTIFRWLKRHLCSILNVCVSIKVKSNGCDRTVAQLELGDHKLRTHTQHRTHTHTIHNLFGFIHERLVRVREKKIKSQSKMKKKKIEQNRESCTIRRASDVHGNKHKA